MVSGGRGASDGALPWIAAERGVRAAILVAVGVVFLTHTQTDWGRVVTDAARHLGLDPSRNALEHLSGRARRLSPGKLRRYGAVAVAYGMLEAAESYGLGRRRRWGEYLTVAATSVLLIPETGELATKPSPLKALTLVINAAIVAYLVVRLRRREPSPAT
ncbi:MAG: hypothetical protein QOJ23_1669 [Actinomycetota bacterium]|jgi:uncharacterized membrane protein (DUF2068 family)|nr:hypothetical protein [Actinomycetota bacterium]